jgi:hypothetical protein
MQDRAPGQCHGQGERALSEEVAERWAALDTTVAASRSMGSRRHDTSVNSVEVLASWQITLTVTAQNEYMDENAI